MFGAELRQRAARHPLTCFFRSWIQDPFRVGAVAPSSRVLARLMVSRLEPEATVVELGPGTGTFTREILARGVRPENLYLVEQSPRFAGYLAQQFPGARVVCGDALRLREDLGELSGRVDLIVSGLPLLLFSSTQKAELMDGVFTLLAPAGRLHQFTYGGRCPVGRQMLAGRDLRASLIGLTPFNIPPAFVYRVERI